MVAAGNRLPELLLAVYTPLGVAFLALLI